MTENNQERQERNDLARASYHRLQDMMAVDFQAVEEEEPTRRQQDYLYVSWRTDRLYKILATLSTIIFIIALLVIVSQSPRFGDASNPAMNEVVHRYVTKGVEETGATNIVSGMILDYRAFDTFGEALMMFTSATAVICLMKASLNPKDKGEAENE